MPKGEKGTTCKSPAKQETDVETKVIMCLTNVLDKQKLSDGDRRTTDANPTLSDGECRRGERFAIYVEVERHRGLATVLVDKDVPTYTWTEEIIRDHLERDIPEMTQMVILSPTACMFFKGRRSVGEGYTGEQAHEIVGRVSSARMWAGTDALIGAFVVTLGEARHILVKASKFIKRQRIQKLTTLKLMGGAPSTSPKKLEKPAIGKEAEHRRSKVRRADKYWAKKLEAGHTQHTQWLIDERLEALTHPPLIDPPYASGLTSDNEPYELARDVPSDPSPYEVTDSEEEHDDIVAYDTETSHRTTVADRDRLRRRQCLCCECRECQRCKERDCQRSNPATVQE